MDHEIKQKLLLFESRDNVQNWFKAIHNRKLNLIRTKEINSAAKQSSEFFKNAEVADLTVRPLLTFYGIASLSRALILLLKCNGGEESLTSGHGLKTLNWSETLSGDLKQGLLSLGDLEIETCSGLYSSLINETKNRISIHVNTTAVDWKMEYKIPSIGNKFKLFELFSRIPDLEFDLCNIEETPRYASISQITYKQEDGFKAQIPANNFEKIKQVFDDTGYNLKRNKNIYELTCSTEFLEKNIPLFLHKYVHKTFGIIPNLYIVEPFECKECYSEISITYMLSYYLGILVRYYPTHWTALVQGEKGDLYWPILNRAQNFVENVFPQLVIELILDIINDKKKESQDVI